MDYKRKRDCFVFNKRQDLYLRDGKTHLLYRYNSSKQTAHHVYFQRGQRPNAIPHDEYILFSCKHYSWTISCFEQDMKVDKTIRRSVCMDLESTTGLSTLTEFRQQHLDRSLLSTPSGRISYLWLLPPTPWQQRWAHWLWWCLEWCLDADIALSLVTFAPLSV